MGRKDQPAQRVAERSTPESFFASLRHLTRTQWPTELLAGLTLAAIAVPEQVATAQLAFVPPFIALLAFVAGAVIFAMFGSNPVLSVGADSTIAPLFAGGLIALAAAGTGHYFALVALVAVFVGIILAILGLAKLGWVADFISTPIVAGFMVGIGLTIIVHQLPHALGIAPVEGSFVHRCVEIFRSLGSVNGYCVALAFGTLAIVVLGEKISPRAPFALVAVIGATLITKYASLTSHGVATLGTVKVLGPSIRFGDFAWGDVGTAATVAITVAIVVVSQSAATSRDIADEIGVDVNINQDFVAIGLANVVAGVIGTIPVNASPARTGVVRLSGGRTQLVGMVAGALTLLSGLVAGAMSSLPLAALAGVLFFVAARLVKVPLLRQIARVDRYELALSAITMLGVILLGVEAGLGLAVVLALLDQTRRSARPTSVVLGRRPESTSWEPVSVDGAKPMKKVVVVLFGAPLYFANASLFRAEIHEALRAQPESRHLVIDAAAMTTVDFTGLRALANLVSDLDREHFDVAIARANDKVVQSLKAAPSKIVSSLNVYDTVDEAVHALKES